MKLRYSPILLLVCLFIATILSCKKPADGAVIPDILPLETQNGANTFGALVNDKVFLPKGNSTQVLHASIEKGVLSIVAKNQSTNEDMAIALTNFEGVEHYYIAVDSEEINYSLSNEKYIAINGKISIKKFDTANKIISGSFFFKGKEIKTGKIVAISDGRFDVRYN